MIVEVSKANYQSVQMAIPTSKSQANRMLVLAALTQGPVRINHLPKGNDVQKMLSALKQVGLKVELINDDAIIHNSFPECESDHPLIEIRLKTGDGGTTNRFLMAMVGLGSKTYLIDSEGPMRLRPMDELESALALMGVKCERGTDYWYKIQGPYKKNQKEIKLDASRSTQFASAMAMALAPLDVYVVAEKLEASENYFRMTEDLIRQFKSGKREFNVPADGSSLSYPLAWGAIAGNVQIKNVLEVDNLQSDFFLIELLKFAGVEIQFSTEGLSVKSVGQLPPLNNGDELDCSLFPDLVPTLVFLASYATGKSYFSKIKVLRHKESDRIEECLKLLRLFEINHKYDESKDVLMVEGPGKSIDPLQISCPADHRMVMVSFLYLKKNSGGVLEHAEHVNKSFPDFFIQLESI